MCSSDLRARRDVVKPFRDNLVVFRKSSRVRALVVVRARRKHAKCEKSLSAFKVTYRCVRFILLCGANNVWLRRGWEPRDDGDVRVRRGRRHGGGMSFVGVRALHTKV